MLRHSTHPRLFSPSLASVVAALAIITGCESQLNMAGSPALSPQTGAISVRAILATTAAGTLITIDNPIALPEAVRAARELQVAVGGQKYQVTRNPGGYYTFALPATARLNTDVDGSVKMVFVIDQKGSQIVTLQTGSPVQFANPPVLTDPSPGFLVRGLDVRLKANTDATTDQYQFTWAYSTTGTAPWVPIPGQGKEVKWTPPQPGNFFVKVDAVDRATQQAYSTTTPSALIFVTDGDEVVTTEPASGSIQRGESVALGFNRPAGLRGTNLSYAWSIGPSLQGPWSLASGNGDKVNYLPTGIGSYFVKVEVSDKDTGTVNTFITPDATIFVNEGRPIVTANPSNVLRGDRVGLDLNLTVPGTGPVSWSYAKAGSPSWLPLSGTGRSNALVVSDAGSYNFKVDVPDASGAVKSFTTTDPVLTVSEGATPLIVSDPPNAVITQGARVTLKLNARGLDDVNYRYTWFYTTNPMGGWQALPLETGVAASKKSYEWATDIQTPIGIVRIPAGSYFIRVDASEKNGTNTFTFTSSSPVVTIEK